VRTGVFVIYEKLRCEIGNAVLDTPPMGPMLKNGDAESRTPIRDMMTSLSDFHVEARLPCVNCKHQGTKRGNMLFPGQFRVTLSCHTEIILL
jgi:hypothetical protein